MTRSTRAVLFALVALLGTEAHPVAEAAATSAVARLLVEGKPAAEVVVWLEAPDVPRQVHTVTLDQRNLRFYPTTLVTTVGSTVEFPNNDRVLHNVFSFRDGKRFDLGVYPVGKTKRVTFDRAGVSRLLCNIHPGMASYIVVVDSPYFGVTDRDGMLELRGVPPGTYTYHAWRAGHAPISNTLTIAPDARLDIQWPAR